MEEIIIRVREEGMIQEEEVILEDTIGMSLEKQEIFHMIRVHCHGRGLKQVQEEEVCQEMVEMEEEGVHLVGQMDNIQGVLHVSVSHA